MQYLKYHIPVNSYVYTIHLPVNTSVHLTTHFRGQSP